MGGLGNQMFQYAFGKALSLFNKSDLFFDLVFFSDVRSGKDKISTVRDYELSIFKNISLQSANISVKKKMLGSKLVNVLKYKLGIKRNNFYQENKFSYNEKVEELPLPIYLLGYWQSFKYFNDFQEIIRNEFQFNYENIGNKNNEVLGNIRNNISAVSLHVRRGDYLKSPYFISMEDYYNSAIDYIKKKLKNPIFILFSDDPQWVYEKLVPLLENSILVDWNVKEDSWKDMMLMSNCSHHIIANSSFSWWGAWLGNNPDKIVIAPQKWFLDSSVNTKDLYLQNWIIL